MKIIEILNDINRSFKRSTKLNIATIIIQNATAGVSPMFQLLYQQQTTNFNSAFNQIFLQFMVKSGTFVMDQGYDISIFSIAFYALLCDAFKNNSYFTKCSINIPKVRGDNKDIYYGNVKQKTQLPLTSTDLLYLVVSYDKITSSY